jgi:periplasmic divalent cation tolerance protein
MAYVPCPSREVALSLARTLLEEKLIACANVLGGMSSIYVWENKIQEEEETLLLAKTSEPVWEALEARIIELHPYDLPCIVAYHADKSSDAFAQWLSRNVVDTKSEKI